MISHNPDYFSINAIMATNERIPCTLMKTAPRLGFLIPGNENSDISEGTVMELPLWLIPRLAHDRFIKVQCPKMFSEKKRSIFEADPKVINLFGSCPYFYEFGRSFANINHRESEIIQSLIVKTFKDRCCLLLDWADNVMTEANKIQLLDVSERNLLKLGHKARVKLDYWLTDEVSQLQSSELVQNLRKRKLINATHL